MRRVTATLQSDAALGARPSTSFTKDTLRYIPGSVLRGAVAARYLARGAPIDEAFISLFERDIAWGPLHLTGESPSPMSWWEHKYGRIGARTTCPTVWDDSDPANQPPGDRICPSCGTPLQQSKGQLPPVKLSEDAHVHLVDGVAADGDLFSRRRLSRDQTFTGHLRTLNDRVQLGQALDELLRDSTTVSLGGRRSTDGGRADLSWTDADPPPLEVHDGWLSFMLMAPGIFVDDAGRPCAHPRTDELRDALGVDCRVERSWHRWETVGGWHAAAGIPKPEERVVAPGSVFRLSLEGEPTPQGLSRLVNRGVGLRRLEGFGSLGPMPQISAAEPSGSASQLHKSSVGKVRDTERPVQVGASDTGQLSPVSAPEGTSEGQSPAVTVSHLRAQLRGLASSSPDIRSRVVTELRRGLAAVQSGGTAALPTVERAAAMQRQEPKAIAVRDSARVLLTLRRPEEFEAAIQILEAGP